MADFVDLVVTGVAESLSASELSDRLVAEFGQSAETFSELVNGAVNPGACYSAQSDVSIQTATEGKVQLEKIGLVCEIRSSESGQTVSTAEPEVEEKADTTQDAGETHEDHLPAENGLEVVDLSFEDELNDLSAIKQREVTGKSNEIPAPEQPVSAPASEEEPESEKENSDELVFEENDQAGTTDAVVIEDTSTADDGKAEDGKEKAVAQTGLEIELDDARSLDDGNLSLSEDNQSALSSKSSAHAVKGVVNLKAAPSAVADSLELTLDDAAPEPAAAPVANVSEVAPQDESQETLVSSEDELTSEAVSLSEENESVDSTNIEAAPDPGDELTAANESPAEIPAEIPEDTQSEDLAREEVAATAPVQEEVDAGTSGTATLDSETAGDSSAQGIAEGDGGTSALSSIIADIETAGADGLVIPAQAGSVEPPPPVEPQQSTMEQQVELLRQSREEVAVLQEKIEKDIEEETKVSSQFKLNGLRKEARRLAVAAGVLAFVGAAATGGYLSGMFGSSEVVPQTAIVVDVPASNDVEDVSLNAAIERTAAMPNPEKFSTEELLVYLAEGLGTDSVKDLEGFMSGNRSSSDHNSEPRAGAAIAADIRSKLWLKNRVAHPADQYFDEWSKRERDLRVFLELQERLMESGDLNVASELGKRTKDKFFAVMSAQRLARAYGDRGQTDRAKSIMRVAARDTYAIPVASERIMAIADYALTEQELGLNEDAMDSFLKVSILARNLNKPENRTVGLSAVATFFQKAGHEAEARQNLVDALESANQLPEYTAARDLAIRHVALTEVSMGFTAAAMDHAHLIVDPFAAVSAYHGIALLLEKNGEDTKARRTINMAFRAGSLIEDSAKRTKLLEQVKLAGD